MDGRKNILPTSGQNDVHKKVVSMHQGNEYTNINRHGEGLCFMCWKKDTAFARNIHICKDCLAKKGKQSILAKIMVEPYGLCYNCGKYKFELHYLNIRTCHKCATRISNIIEEWQKNDGMMGNDPFWVKLKKDFGKDYEILMNPYSKQTGAVKR